MKMKRWFGILTALLILAFCAGAAAEEEGSFPALNDAGFLDSGEFVFEDEENGVWRYAKPCGLRYSGGSRPNRNGSGMRRKYAVRKAAQGPG